MNLFEISLSSLGLSWTLSKLLPYILFLVIGIFFAVIFHKKFKLLKPLKIIISLAIFVLPFLLYFVYSPIYQGDFSNSGYTVSSENRFPDKKQFTVYVLPNCKYCVSSTATLKAMIRKNKGINLVIRVLGHTDNDSLKYVKLMDNLVPVTMNSSNNSIEKVQIKELITITQGEFPTFVLSKNGKAIKAWHNDSFGVRAMDEVDHYFN
jgi:glutaredoxin